MLRRASRSGEEVGWKTGRGPRRQSVVGHIGRKDGGCSSTMLSPRRCGGEAAGLGDDAAETGAAVAGQVGGEGGHCGQLRL